MSCASHSALLLFTTHHYYCMKQIAAIILLINSLFLPIMGQSSYLSDSIKARQLAQQWFSTHGSKAYLFNKAPQTISANSLNMKSFAAGWLCTQNDQFVVIGTQTPLVLGYGTTLNNQMPVALQTWLNTTPRSVHHYPLDGTQWQEVTPLLTTQHSFGSPYNDLCPYFTDDEGNVSSSRCVAGCVAIAMEQVLTYYRRTYTLQDTLHGWSTPHYTIPDILPGFSVDSRLIADNYKQGHGTVEQRNAVAQLMYSLGVASHMNWGLNASGTNTQRLIEPLKQAFGLKHVVYLDSYLYDPVSYWTYLAQSIMAKRPVYYAGGAMTTEGHAFVLDGLDKNGFFHVNWGYGGNYDGYFRLDILALREPLTDRNDKVDNGFFCNQEALVVCPDEVTDLLPPDTLHRVANDVRVDSMWTIDEPSTTCRSRIALAVRNTTERMLTTTFALLLNEPTDTALFKQADWFAYTGCTLKAGETDTLIVHTTYPKNGERIMSVTTDGEQMAYQLNTFIGEQGTTNISFDAPQISFHEPCCADIQQHLSNPLPDQRAAATFMTTLVDDETGIDVQKTHRIYLKAAADTTFYVNFRELVPGRSYTLQLQRVWPIVYTTQFTLPTTDGIQVITTNDNKNANPTYYNLDGQCYGTIRPTQPGVYIMKRNHHTNKIIISRSSK